MIDFWIDTRTEFGFIREHNKSKYFYDNKNNLIHSEIKWSQPKFSPLKKENKLKDKIGTIDFEIYYSSFDLGLHKVSAGGWAIEGQTKLFYKNKNKNETN